MGSKVGPTQLSDPQTRPELKWVQLVSIQKTFYWIQSVSIGLKRPGRHSELESQSPCPAEHGSDEVQHEFPPSQLPATSKENNDNKSNDNDDNKNKIMGMRERATITRAEVTTTATKQQRHLLSFMRTLIVCFLGQTASVVGMGQ